jgi:hypothetical protein
LFCGVFGWCGIFEIRFKLRTGGNIFWVSLYTPGL